MQHTDQSETLTIYRRTVEIKVIDLEQHLRQFFKLPATTLITYHIDSETGDPHLVTLTHQQEQRT